MAQHFCTACGREVYETQTSGHGYSARFHCSCGADHIAFTGGDGNTYLTRVLPVHRMPDRADGQSVALDGATTG